MKTNYCLIVLMALGLMLTACTQKVAEVDADNEVIITETDNEEYHLAATAPAADQDTMAAPEPRYRPMPAAAPAKPRTAPAKPKPAPETIYVETIGALGKVWGHVTMTGDRGSGTIHDVDENTLAVTVTRHGDELFAVDQNSRQYVFKLRK